jgi:hypothetical protein
MCFGREKSPPKREAPSLPLPTNKPLPDDPSDRFSKDGKVSIRSTSANPSRSNPGLSITALDPPESFKKAT